jgi:hypothetical protein
MDGVCHSPFASLAREASNRNPLEPTPRSDPACGNTGAGKVCCFLLHPNSAEEVLSLRYILLYHSLDYTYVCTYQPMYIYMFIFTYMCLVVVVFANIKGPRVLDIAIVDIA